MTIKNLPTPTGIAPSKVINIPDQWSATWFRNFIKYYLQGLGGGGTPGPNSITDAMLVEGAPLSVKGNPTNATADEQDIAASGGNQMLVSNSAGTDLTWAPLQGTGVQVRGATWSGGNAAILSANQTDVSIIVPTDSVITRCSITTKGGTGSCEVDIWSSPVASYPPTVANSICPANHPKVTAGIVHDDLTLTGFNTTVPNGNVITFHLVSSSVFSEVTVMLALTPTNQIVGNGYTNADAIAAVAAALSNSGNVQFTYSGGAISANTGFGTTWGPSTVAQQGAITFPNGLILMWGKVTASGSGNPMDITVTFAPASYPSGFPNNCFGCWPVGSRSVSSDGQAADGSNFISNVIKTGCVITIDSHATTAYTAYWFALGN